MKITEKEILQIDLKTVEYELYKRSYYEFFKKAMTILEPETEWDFNWHIEYICDILQEEVFRIRDKKPKLHDLVVNIPPGSSKSSIFSICLTGWAWLHCPFFKIASTSFNAKVSEKFVRTARDLVSSSWYQDLFKDEFKLTKSTETYFTNNRGGISKSGARTSEHFDIIVGDDLLSPVMAKSQTERNNVNDFWFKTVPSRFKKLKDGLKVVVMQRLHEEDVCGKILEKKLNYKWVVIPAELENNLQPKELAKYYKNGLFWEERYPKNILEEKKKELSPREYAGQYLQKPAPDDGIIFERKWFKFFKPSDVPENLTKYFYTDSAHGQPNSDRTPTICWSIYKGNIYIWYVEAVRMPLPKWVDYYVEMVKMQGGDGRSAHFVEAAASGFEIEQSLREETNLNIILDKLPAKISKVMRAEASAMKPRSGRIYLLENAHWIEDFLYELAVFPNGRFDDIVDCFSGLVRNSDLTYNENQEELTKSIRF